jgi:multidrug resistance protein MdtO
MPAQSETLPRGIDQASKWFWNFIKAELTPYPGRAWVAARMTVSATIVMVLVVTFRIPEGFQGAIFTLIISRENPAETFFSGFRTVVGFLIGTLYTLFSIRMLIDDPLTHFLWIVGTFFLFFYLLRIVADYGTAAALGFGVLGSISLWDDNTLNRNTQVENTLWLAGVVALGVVVTIAVEYVFRRAHPVTDLTEGIEARMQTVEDVLRSAASEQPLESEQEKKLSLYATVGTSRLSRLVLRSEYSRHFKTQMGATIALVRRLVDIAANFELALSERTEVIDPADRQRCQVLADEVAEVRKSLTLRQLPTGIKRPSQETPSQLPFLSMM